MEGSRLSFYRTVGKQPGAIFQQTIDDIEIAIYERKIAMGEANRRGSIEERKAQAMLANQNKTQSVKIDLDAIPFVTCDHELSDGNQCKSTEFIQVTQFKRISAIMSRNGKEQITAFPVFRCMQCGFTKIKS